MLSVSDLPDSAVDERVIAAARAHTRALGVPIEVVRHVALPAPATLAREGQALAQRREAHAVLWIELARDGSAALYLAEPTHARVYTRSLPARGGGVTARAESIANVVSLIVAASLEGQLAAGGAAAGLELVAPDVLEVPLPDVPRSAAPPATTTTPATTTPATTTPAATTPATRAPQASPAAAWSRLRLAAGYAGSTFAAGLPWHDGLALAVGWRPAPRALLDLGHEVLPGAAIRGELVTLVLRRHPLTLTGGRDWALGRLDLRVAARLSLDIVRRDARSAAPQVTVSDDTVRLFSSVAALVGVGFRPAAQVRVGVTLGVEILLRRFEYAAYAPAREVVLSPLPVRFTAALGVEFELLRRPRGRKKS